MYTVSHSRFYKYNRIVRCIGFALCEHDVCSRLAQVQRESSIDAVGNDQADELGLMTVPEDDDEVSGCDKLSQDEVA